MPSFPDPAEVRLAAALAVLLSVPGMAVAGARWTEAPFLSLAFWVLSARLPLPREVLLVAMLPAFAVLAAGRVVAEGRRATASDGALVLLCLVAAAAPRAGGTGFSSREAVDRLALDVLVLVGGTPGPAVDVVERGASALIPLAAWVAASRAWGPRVSGTVAVAALLLPWAGTGPAPALALALSLAALGLAVDGASPRPPGAPVVPPRAVAAALLVGAALVAHLETALTGLVAVSAVVAVVRRRPPRASQRFTVGGEPARPRLP